MRLFCFEDIKGNLFVKIAKRNITEAIEWFHETYPHRTFATVYEK